MPPPLDPADGKCQAASGRASMWVVGWEPAERQRLQEALDDGVVAVRYEGCELGLVANCRARASYQFVGLEADRQSLPLPDVFELHAQMPRGAAQLEGALDEAGALALDFMKSGRRESSLAGAGVDLLEGSGCAVATHVVTAVEVGAFRLRTAPPSPQEPAVLGVDGNVPACGEAQMGAVAPPVGCSVPLRIELEPVDQVRRRNQIVMARGSLFTPGTPWRKPAVIGVASFGAMVAGMAMLGVGLNLSQDAEDPITMEVDRSRRVPGVALSVVGGILFYGGFTAGVVGLSIAGVRRKRARRAVGIAVGPGTIRLRF